MNEKIDLNDWLFLVSRSIDGDLSAAEQVRLDEALAASAEFGVEAKKLRRVAGLVQSRRAANVQIDWETYGQLVLAKIAEDEIDLAGVDSMLKQWGARSPQYDERDLTRNVMARIAPARQRGRSAWQSALRLGAPLAAAAVVVLAVLPAFYPVRNYPNYVSPVTDVQIGPAWSGESDAAVAIVSFAKPAAHDVDASQSLSFGYMTLGLSPNGQLEESPL